MEPYQIQSILEMLIVTAGGLTGLWIVARAWTHRRAGGTRSKEITGLTESVDKMRESLEQMRDDLLEVSERLDFTERVLARLGEEGRPPHRLPNP